MVRYILTPGPCVRRIESSSCCANCCCVLPSSSTVRCLVRTVNQILHNATPASLSLSLSLCMNLLFPLQNTSRSYLGTAAFLGQFTGSPSPLLSQSQTRQLGGEACHSVVTRQNQPVASWSNRGGGGRNRSDAKEFAGRSQSLAVSRPGP